VRLAQTISLNWYFTKELLMPNDTLMKYSIHLFLFLALVEERIGYFIQDSTHS
jgi:hypothetical protein